MGVTTDILADQAADEVDTAEDSTSAEGPNRETSRNLDPFLQGYSIEEWSMDSETVNQMLTGLVAVTNMV